MRAFMGVIIAMFMVAACQVAPMIEVTYPDGRTVQVSGVPGQAQPATLTDTSLEISTGGVDQALQHLSGSANWLAIVLILAGVATLIASTWVPMLPRSMSVICIAAGGGLFAFPILIDRYSTYVFIGLAIVGGLMIYGTWDNRKKLQWQS